MYRQPVYMCTCMSKSLDLHEHKYNRRSIAISNPTKTRAILLGRGGGVVMGTAASVATSLLGEGCISAGGLADGDVAPDGTAVGIPEDTTSPGLASEARTLYPKETLKPHKRVRS